MIRPLKAMKEIAEISKALQQSQGISVPQHPLQQRDQTKELKDKLTSLGLTEDQQNEIMKMVQKNPSSVDLFIDLLQKLNPLLDFYQKFESTHTGKWLLSQIGVAFKGESPHERKAKFTVLFESLKDFLLPLIITLFICMTAYNVVMKVMGI